MEEIQITDGHLIIMREKYDCEGLTNEQIIQAMVKWDKMKRDGVFIVAFPDFQSVLDFIKRKK